MASRAGEREARISRVGRSPGAVSGDPTREVTFDMPDEEVSMLMDDDPADIEHTYADFDFPHPRGWVRTK